MFHLCRYDYVEIHDGNSESADLLGKHCSNIAPAPIISSGPSLHIKFVSDYAHQGAGFSLRYEIFKTGEYSLLFFVLSITINLSIISYTQGGTFIWIHFNKMGILGNINVLFVAH